MKVKEILGKIGEVTVERPQHFVWNHKKNTGEYQTDIDAPPSILKINGQTVKIYSTEGKMLVSNMDKEVLHWKCRGGLLAFSFYSMGKMKYFIASTSNLLSISLNYSLSKQIFRYASIKDYDNVLQEMDKINIIEGEETTEDYNKYTLVEKMR